MTIQHDEARRLLPIVIDAARTHQFLTYQSVAERLGRPRNNARTVAQICELLDAAAALADVPLLALITVLNADNKINPKAWGADSIEPGIRDAIIKRSLAHTFTRADFDAIAEALEKLKDKTNKSAWKYLRSLLPPGQLHLRLTGADRVALLDAVDDLGSDQPAQEIYTGRRYVRNPKVREAVKRRAAGKCEYCGVPGFKCEDGEVYLECHHIIALADDGEDRMSNVIAICAGDHREAHFGVRRREIEAEMIAKVKAAEAHRAKAVV